MPFPNRDSPKDSFLATETLIFMSADSSQLVHTNGCFFRRHIEITSAAEPHTNLMLRSVLFLHSEHNNLFEKKQQQIWCPQVQEKLTKAEELGKALIPFLRSCQKFLFCCVLPLIVLTSARAWLDVATRKRTGPCAQSNKCQTFSCMACETKTLCRIFRRRRRSQKTWEGS